MKRHSSHRSPPGQRQLRVGERIRHILADVLREGSLHDPALAQSNLITVTAVDIGPDLQHAIAYVMPLGGKNAEAIVEALNRCAMPWPSAGVSNLPGFFGPVDILSSHE